MRVMVIVKASKESEAGALPSTELLAKMGKYNEELAKAGVLLAAEGLRPSSHGKRVKFSGPRPCHHGWAVCGDKGADRGLLDMAREVDR
jgi:hypothetical protein